MRILNLFNWNFPRDRLASFDLRNFGSIRNLLERLNLFLLDNISPCWISPEQILNLCLVRKLKQRGNNDYLSVLAHSLPLVIHRHNWVIWSALRVLPLSPWPHRDSRAAVSPVPRHIEPGTHHDDPRWSAGNPSCIREKKSGINLTTDGLLY